MPKLQSSPFQKHHFIFSLACGSFFVSPACAGKSSSHPECRSERRDHPRICGEKIGMQRHCPLGEGSPPRMRGKVGPIVQLCTSAGITPAYAGKSSRTAWLNTDSRDHPRICREKRDTMAFYPCVVGSPPRVRGKDHGEPASNRPLGITPAYAGKRLSDGYDPSFF